MSAQCCHIETPCGCGLTSITSPRSAMGRASAVREETATRIVIAVPSTKEERMMMSGNGEMENGMLVCVRCLIVCSLGPAK